MAPLHDCSQREPPRNPPSCRIPHDRRQRKGERLVVRKADRLLLAGKRSSTPSPPQSRGHTVLGWMAPAAAADREVVTVEDLDLDGLKHSLPSSGRERRRE